MNIIKFKDVIKVNDDNFNKYLKGKYAYWINMRYAIPFEFITEQEYITMSRCDHWLKDPCKKECVFYWDTNRGSINILIDVQETENINSISCYEAKNSFTPGQNLTIDDLKVFRTWLAKRLLEFNKFNEDDSLVINYYANGMYDNTVKILSKIDRKLSIPVTGSHNSCSMCSDISNLNVGMVDVCDPLETYRTYIYKLMVEKFSDIDFWKSQYTPFMEEFKWYIDDILKVGFTIEETTDNYLDCSCTGDSDDYFKDILRRLSRSIEYILDDETCGHRLYIAKAFNDWATYCYEKMYWK